MAKKAAEEDSYFFIAMPFTTKMVPSPPYKGTDPEWIRFGEISKDKELQGKIRGLCSGCAPSFRQPADQVQIN